jgi:hypothetical protein
MNKNGIVFIVGLNLLVPVVKALLMSIDTCFTFLLIAQFWYQNSILETIKTNVNPNVNFDVEITAQFDI